MCTMFPNTVCYGALFMDSVHSKRSFWSLMKHNNQILHVHKPIKMGMVSFEITKKFPLLYL